jgi:hypothetical protein
MAFSVAVTDSDVDREFGALIIAPNDAKAPAAKE